jgi:GTPase SAR1 family protein
MEPFKQFETGKQTTVQALRDLHAIIAELGEMEVDVQADLKKIITAIEAVQSDVLRIALLGAFSDGKTSVIAAWLGRVMDDMKISMDESSDRLAIYKPEGLPGQCEIVDTPGLFGDKEREIDGEQVLYQDLTKRYISEAHLILYVVDATNPLKDSHKEIVRWLLRDLNKLSSIVFVINKMDEVTDLTEPAMFDEQSMIKRNNLKEKLQRAANLDATELERLNIICLASDPNGRGLPFWFGKPELYEARSRINALKAVTDEILTANVPAVLSAKTGLDVVLDLVRQRTAAVAQQLDTLRVFAEQNQEQNRRFSQDILSGRAEIKRLAAELTRELRGMENLLMSKLRPLSLEEIRPYLEDELGYTEDGVGYKLNLNIKQAIDRFFEESSAVTHRISDDINRQLHSSESFFETYAEGSLKAAGNVLKGLSKINPEAIKSTIFLARDALASVSGFVFKFKPWQASNLAGSISKWAGPAGAAFSVSADLYGAYKERELEKELSDCKTDIGNIIKPSFKSIYDLLSDDSTLFETFAPQIKTIEDVVGELTAKEQAIFAHQRKIADIQQRLQALATAQ